MAASDSTAPERRRFSISSPRPQSIGVATFVLVVVAAVLHFGIPLYRTQAVKRAVQRLGGRTETRQGGPERLRMLVGNELMKPFDEVVTVYLGHTATTDADLATFASLDGLASIETLDLSGTLVTDTGIARVPAFSELRELYLNGTQVGDDCVQHLIPLVKLEQLSFDHTKLTDRGIAELKGMTNLQRLYLKRTHITDLGLAELKSLTGLVWLQLNGTHVTDAGLVHLKEHKRLRELDVRDTDVTDAGIANLKLVLPNVKLR